MILSVGLNPAFQKTMEFDDFALDQVNRVKRLTETASGKGINVARVLTDLGRDAVATGFLGGDTGRFMLDELAAGGIKHDFVWTEARTRTCVTLLSHGAMRHTELVEEARPVSSGEVKEMRVWFETLAADADMVTVSGTAPPGVPLDMYAHFTRVAHRWGIPIIIDAPGELLRNSLAARPLLVKPNLAELARALGRDLNTVGAIEDALREVIESGARWCALSQGAGPVLVMGENERFDVIPPTVDAVNPIGSGDALTAGIAARLVEGASMADALRFGVACGAANTLTLTAGTVRPADVERLSRILSKASSL